VQSSGAEDRDSGDAGSDSLSISSVSEAVDDQMHSEEEIADEQMSGQSMSAWVVKTLFR
jgi:hypothetical protein